MKNYLKYLLYNNRKLFFMMIIIFIITHPLVVFAQFVNSPNLFTSGVDEYTYINFSSIAMIALIIVAMVIPIVIQIKRMRSNGIDVLFSLPLSREKLMITDLIYGWIIIFIPFMISCVIEIVFLSFQSMSISLALVATFACYIIIISGWYCFNMFITSKCNSIKDAIIVEILYFVIFALLVNTTYSFFYNHSINQDIAEKMIGEVSKILSFISPTNALISVNYSMNLVIGIIYLIYIMIFSWLIIKTAKYKKAEDCGEVSSNILYPTALMIIIFILLIANANSYQSVASVLRLYVFLFICYISISFIAQRNFKIKLRHILLFIISVSLSYLFSYAYTQTGCFNLAYEYKSMENVENLYITCTESQSNEDIYSRKYNVVRENKDLVGMTSIANEIQDYLISNFKKNGCEQGLETNYKLVFKYVEADKNTQEFYYELSAEQLQKLENKFASYDLQFIKKD